MTTTTPIQLSRRDFLRLCAAAGMSLAGGSLLASCAIPRDVVVPSEGERFLRDVGAAFTGTTLRITSEPSTLSQTIATLAEREFTPLTGIAIEWNQQPLASVLSSSIDDIERQQGRFDLYDWDQAWLGSLAPYARDLQPFQARADLAFPDYAFDDLLPPLRDHLALHEDRLIGIPFDVPLFVLFYRSDLLEALQLPVPTTFAQYRTTAQAIQAAYGPQIYGTLGQWAQGHYALECEMTAWLWGHGGSIFGSNGQVTLGDAPSVAALENMLAMQALMPPGVTRWDWWDAGASFARGEAGMALFWNTFAPAFQHPTSPIAGKVGIAPCPMAAPARSASATSFGEKPGVSHQGGSVLSISRYSRNPEAAWIFLQWATSPAVLQRATLLTGATPIRASSYAQREQMRAHPHFAATQSAILTQLGSEPRIAEWSSLAVDSFAHELGRMVTWQQDIPTTLARMAQAADREAHRGV